MTIIRNQLWQAKSHVKTWHLSLPILLCKDCGHEYLLAFSCKRRHFCPSCHQKRVVEFGEWLCMDVLKKIPHRHFVFSIPKILRRYFLYDRKLLADLSRCAWESLKVFIQGAVPGDNRGT
ncbi:MAG: transposase zinc-binding domain-containing protein [Syntrophales bacterium]